MRLTFAAACFWVVIVAGAATSEGVRLLTANRRPDPASATGVPPAELAKAGYYAVPRQEGEAGGPENLISFAQGILSDGSVSGNWRVQPPTYAYWTGTPRGELVFELGVPCLISAVRVHVFATKSSGVRRIRLFDREDVVELPDGVLLGSLEPPVPGWNAFENVGTFTDGLRLVFDRAPGKDYMHVSEVEILGVPKPEEPLARSAGGGDRGVVEEADGRRWYAFDFGLETSPVAPYCTRVWRDTAYSAARGYGWEVPGGAVGRHVDDSNFEPPSRVVPGLNDRDRGGGSHVDALRRDFVMTKAAYHSQTRLQFCVDVPAGAYRVVTFHSDLKYGHVGLQYFAIEAEGKRFVAEPRFQTLHGRCDFEVTVDDGRLDLVFSSTHPVRSQRGWHLNGLLAFPVDTAADRRFAQVKLTRFLAFLDRAQARVRQETFTEKPHVEENPMPEVLAVDRVRGFTVFVPNWMEMVYQNTVPTPAARQRKAHAFACRGEREPYVIAIRTLAPVSAMRVSISELVGPERIPADAWDVRVVRYHPQRIGGSPSRTWRVMPQILDPNRPIDLDADVTQAFWLTLRVPETAMPGVYRGEIALTGDRGAATVPVIMEVLPFTLAGPGKWIGVYWQPARCDTRERLLKQIADMRAHGVNAVSAPPPWPHFALKDDELLMDSAETLAYLQLLQSRGLEGPTTSYFSLDRTARQLFGADRVAEGMQRLVAAVMRMSQRADTPELLWYPVDEIGNSESKRRQFLRVGALIKQVDSARVYCTVNHFESGRRCAEYIDCWCSNIVLTPEQERCVHESGKEYMRYGPHFMKDPRQVRSSAGFGFYRRRATAMYYWHYQKYSVDPFDDLDGGVRDWCCSYPGPDSPIPTMDWEGLGEGIDDLRYINTLKLLAAQCVERSGTAAAMARQALAALDALLEQDAPNMNAYAFMSGLSDDEFHAVRRQIVNLILPLHRLVGTR